MTAVKVTHRDLKPENFLFTSKEVDSAMRFGVGVWDLDVSYFVIFFYEFHDVDDTGQRL